VVAFCIAGLAALAVDRLARQPSYAPSVKRVVWTALATMSTIAFFVAYHWSFLTGKGSAVRWMAQQLAMTVVVMALFVVAAVRTRRTPRSAAALFGLLLAELIFFVPRNLVPRVDAFRVPPFVEYLRRDDQPARVYGLGGVLYP